jgi:hypothetical protein
MRIDPASVTEKDKRLASLAPRMLEVLEHQAAAQGKIFTYLNSYAKKEHLKDWQCLSLEGLIAQTYGDLAAGNAELLAIVAEANL